MGNSGVFSVKYNYKNLLVREVSTSPNLSVWISRIPRKMCFLAWLAVRSMILTVKNLRNKKIIYVNWCFMCKNSGEDVDHLLLHCRVTSHMCGR